MIMGSTMRAISAIIIATSILVATALIRGVTFVLTHAVGAIPPPH